MLLKCCTQYVSKFGKLSSGHRTGKGQFSSQCQIRAVLKNVQATRQLHLTFHASKVMLKILQARLQQYMNQELAEVQGGFRKGTGTRVQVTNIFWIRESKGQKNIDLCFVNYDKVFDCMDHNKLWNTLKEIGIPDSLTCFLRNLYVDQEAIVKSLYGTTDWFRIEKGVSQSCLLYPVCLTYTHSILCKTLGWMSYKLESRLPRETSTTSDMQMIPL